MSCSLIAFALLGAQPVEAARPVWAECAVIRAGDSAEEFWARALFVCAVSHTWRDAPENLADRLFAAALDRADGPTRARILVTAGEYGAGSGFATTAKAALEETTRETGDLIARTAGAREAAESLAAVPAQADALAESLSEEQEDATDEQYRAIINRMIDTMEQAREQAGADAFSVYTAAVQADPENLGAWFRLVWVTEGEAQDAALAELRRRDPDNALPWIATGVVLLERKEFAAAVAPLREAAQRSHCRLYPAALPEQFRLRFPNDKVLRSWGVAGETVSPLALRHLLHISKEMSDAIGGDPWERRVYRALAWSTEEYVAASIKVGLSRQAADVTEACCRAGWKLLEVEPADAGVFVGAVFPAGGAAEEAAAAYRLAGDPTAAAEMQRLVDRLKDTRAKRGELAPKDLPKDWFARMVRGEWDELARWERFVTRSQEALGLRAHESESQ